MSNEIKYSSWRRDDIEVKAGEIKDFSFYDTKPNLFYIQNVNSTDIYVGLQYMPSVEKYEFKIQANSYDTIGRPLPCGHIYIYNPGNNSIVVTVYSVNDVFNIAMLKNYALAVDSITTQSEMSFKAGVSLPSGNNTIGKVGIESGNVGLNEGTNTIGKVEPGVYWCEIYERISSICVQMLTALSSSGDIYTKLNTIMGLINNYLVITLDNMENKKLKYTDFCREFSGTGSTTLTIGEDIQKVMSIVNDGESDIIVKYFDNSEVQTGSHIIKPNEVFENIDVYDCYAVQIVAKTSGDNYKCRVIGH